MNESEIGLIGCCLVGGLDTCIDALDAVKPGDFADETCKLAFDLIESMVADGKEVNLVTFVQGWKSKYNFKIPEALLSAADNIPSASAVTHFANDVADTAKRRKIAESAKHLAAKANDKTLGTDSLIADAEAMLYGHDVAAFPLLSSKACAQSLVADLEYRFNLKGKRSGIETGFSKLDKMTDGLQPGEQVIIGARPSVGKTAFGLNIVEHACLRNGIPSLIISLEMSEAALMRRIASSWCQIPMGKLKSGQYTHEELVALTNFQVYLAKSPLFVVNGIAGMDCNRLAAVTRRAVRKHGIKLVVVDYLQKIRAPDRHEKKTYEIAQVSSTLRAVAVSTKTAFVTLAQLNRESDKDKGRMPKVSDLADSGQIERDADVIGLLHRKRTEEDPNGSQALLSIAKQRDGEVGPVPLEYEGQFCKFRTPEYDHD